MAKHDGVGHLHHGGLDVQGEHHTGLVRVFDLFLVKLEQGFLAHVHAVHDLAVLQRHFGFQHDRLAALGDELHFYVTRLVQRDRFFTMVEIAVVHVGDMGARCLAPLGHRVGVLAGIVFYSQWRATVRITFA